jgi:hypothetical protein
MVAGGLALALANPIIFLALLFVFVLALVLLLRVIIKGLTAIVRRFSPQATAA